METLKQLIELIKELPDVALWVLAGYFFYKIIIVGSVYGLIKFVAQKIHDVLTRPKKVKFEIGNLYFNEDDAEAMKGAIANYATASNASCVRIHSTDSAKVVRIINEAANELRKKR